MHNIIIMDTETGSKLDVEQIRDWGLQINCILKKVNEYVDKKRALVLKRKRLAEYNSSSEDPEKIAQLEKNIIELDTEIDQDTPALTAYPELVHFREEYMRLEDEISIMRPIVMDVVRGNNIEVQQKFEKLCMDQQAAEQGYNDQAYKICPGLYLLSKPIYDMIIRGTSMVTLMNVLRTFGRMQNGEMTDAEAQNYGMDFSEQHYNLPKGFFDPVRPPKGGGKKKK